VGPGRAGACSGRHESDEEGLEDEDEREEELDPEGDVVRDAIAQLTAGAQVLNLIDKIIGDAAALAKGSGNQHGPPEA
jgi:hypothetical protein